MAGVVFQGLSGANYPFDVTKREHFYKVAALNQQDLDRNFCLATTHLFKWMQASRMELPWMQAGYRNFCEVEPKMTRRMLVGSQCIRMASPGILAEAVDNEVTTKVVIGDIGKSTIEFRYGIFFGERQVASGCTIMIATGGTPGNFKPTAVPEDVKALESPEKGSDNKMMKEALASLPKQAPAGAYSHSMMVRYSDEDVNKHANHSAQARYFEDLKEIISYDALADPELRATAEQQLECIMISYTAESRALDQLLVKAVVSSPGVLDIWVERTSPNPSQIARGRMICGGGKMEDSDDRRLRTSKL